MGNPRVLPAQIVDLAGRTPTCREKLGSKAATLIWLAGRGYSVPDGFVIPPSLAAMLRAAPGPAAVRGVLGAIQRLEERCGRAYGAPEGFGVSVRPSPISDSPGYGIRRTHIGQPWNGSSEPDSFRNGKTAEKRGDPLSDLIDAVRLVAGIEPAAEQHAVIVQAMVPFAGSSPGLTGTVLSRDPVFGADAAVGEFREMARDRRNRAFLLKDLASSAPTAARELSGLIGRLRMEYGSDLEMEVALVGEIIWILQLRAMPSLTGPVNPSPNAALSRLPVIARGVVASRGCCVAPLAVHGHLDREPTGPVIALVRDLEELTDEAMDRACGILALSGSRYCHAASKLRMRRIPTLTDLVSTTISQQAEAVWFNETKIAAGRPVAIDAELGLVRHSPQIGAVS